MGVIEELSTFLLESYESFVSMLPSWGAQVINLFLLILVIVIYAVLIWKFYRFIAHKDVIKLNLNQYNTTEHPGLNKLVAGLFYLLEYIILMPFMIFFWFLVFTIFLILLTEGLEIQTIVIISATIIGAIRMLSYIPRYGGELAKEISKLLPFTLLAITITKPAFFHIESIISNISQIPTLFGEITIYLLFIIALEILLRGLDLFFGLIGLQEPELEKEED